VINVNLPTSKFNVMNLNVDKCRLINSKVFDRWDEKTRLSSESWRSQQATTADFNWQVTLWSAVGITVCYSIRDLCRRPISVQEIHKKRVMQKNWDNNKDWTALKHILAQWRNNYSVTFTTKRLQIWLPAISLSCNISERPSSRI